MQLNEVELKSKLKDGSIDVKQIINLIHDLNRKKSPWETNVDIEDKELINLIIDKGFKGCRTEMDTVIGTISSFMLFEIYEERTRNFSQDYKEKIDEISNNIGMFPILTDISLGLFDQRLLNTVNPISIARLYRYVFLSHNTNDNYFQFKYNKDYEKLFEYEKISNFMIIYGDILEQDIQKIDIVNFLQLFDKYSSNVEFFNELLSNGRLTDEEYAKIKHYFFAPSECNIELKTRQDLDNVDEYIKEFINSSNFLCGGSTEFFQKIVGKQFFIEQLYRLNRNPNSLEKLVRSLNLSDGDEETIFLGDIKRLLNLCKEFDKLEFNKTESEELRKQITEGYIEDI